MKILLVGRHHINAGPCNVNRSLIKHSDSDLLYLECKSKVGIMLEIFFKMFCADIVVVSGWSKKIIWMIIRPFLRRRKLIYLMHGYGAYESTINNIPTKKRRHTGEQLFLAHADLILAVSEKFAEWFRNYCPQYADKVAYLNNGVDIRRRRLVKKEPYSIAVTGGNRNIKNNGEVCKAVEKLIAKGLPCKLYIFGRTYENNDDVFDYPFAECMTHLDKSDYYAKLDEISLFVMNSELESFGLAVADAINCNCSLLVSENVGAISLIDPAESGMIHNPHDVDTLGAKIEYILKNPNAERIYKSIDIEEVSEKKAYLKLKRICREVLDGEA